MDFTIAVVFMCHKEPLGSSVNFQGVLTDKMINGGYVAGKVLSFWMEKYHMNILRTVCRTEYLRPSLAMLIWKEFLETRNMQLFGACLFQQNPVQLFHTIGGIWTASVGNRMVDQITSLIH